MTATPAGTWMCSGTPDKSRVSRDGVAHATIVQLVKVDAKEDWIDNLAAEGQGGDGGRTRCRG